MNRRQFIGGVAAAACRPLSAAEPASDRARKVIDSCIDALGGDAFVQMPGHLQTGRAMRFYDDQITGLSPAKIYTKYLEAARGDEKSGKLLKEVQRQVIGSKDDETVLLSATEGWDITFRGAEEIPTEQLDRFRESTLTDIFYILRCRLKEPNMSLFSRGSEVMENQPTDVVDYFDADNRNVTVWIHSSTHVPVKQLVKRWDATAKARRDEVTRYTNYYPAGNGVQLPRGVQRERDGQKVYQLVAESVKIGVFADDMFRLPPGVKFWKKK